MVIVMKRTIKSQFRSAATNIGPTPPLTRTSAPHSIQTSARISERGQSFAEIMVAMAVLGFMIISLYAGFSSGFAVLRVARENLRATQILAERMELIRLIRWGDVSAGFIPARFTAPFYATDTNGPSSGGFDYEGQVRIVKSPVSCAIRAAAISAAAGRTSFRGITVGTPSFY